MHKANTDGVRDHIGLALCRLGEWIMTRRYCAGCGERLEATGEGPCCVDPANQFAVGLFGKRTPARPRTMEKASEQPFDFKTNPRTG